MPKTYQGQEYSDHEVIDLARRVEDMVQSPEYQYLSDLARDSIINDLFNPKLEASDVSKLYGQAIAYQLFFDHVLKKVRREATSAKHNLRRLKEDGSSGSI